jgi:glycolate oxidase
MRSRQSSAPAPCCSRTSACPCRSSAKREVTIAVIAHADDGNTHPLIVFDPADEAMTARAGL